MKAYLIDETRAFSTEYDKGITRANTDILFVIPDKEVFGRIPLVEIGDFYVKLGTEEICKYFKTLPKELLFLKNLEGIISHKDFKDFIKNNKGSFKEKFSYYTKRIIDIPDKSAELLTDFVRAKKRLSEIDRESFRF